MLTPTFNPVLQLLISNIYYANAGIRLLLADTPIWLPTNTALAVFLLPLLF